MSRGLVYRWADIGNKGIRKPLPAWITIYGANLLPMRPFTKNPYFTNWHRHWIMAMAMWVNVFTKPTLYAGTGVNSLPERPVWNSHRTIVRKFLKFRLPSIIIRKKRRQIQFEVRNWCTNEEDTLEGKYFLRRKRVYVANTVLNYATFLKNAKRTSPFERGELTLHFQNYLIIQLAIWVSEHSVQTGALASSLAHLGNISYRLGKQRIWCQSKRFIGSDTRCQQHADPWIPCPIPDAGNCIDYLFSILIFGSPVKSGDPFWFYEGTKTEDIEIHSSNICSV